MKILKYITPILIVLILSVPCVFASDNALTYEQALAGFNFNVETVQYFANRFTKSSSNNAMQPGDLLQLSEGLGTAGDSYPAFKLLHMIGMDQYYKNKDYDYKKLGGNFLYLYNNWAYTADELFYLLEERELEIYNLTYKWDNEGECLKDLSVLSNLALKLGMSFKDAFTYIVRVPNEHMRQLPYILSSLYSLGFSVDQLKELVLYIEPSHYEPELFAGQIKALTESGLSSAVIMNLLAEYDKDFLPRPHNFRRGYNPEFSALLQVLKEGTLNEIINGENNSVQAMYLINQMLQTETISVDELAELGGRWRILFGDNDGAGYFLKSIDEYLTQRNSMLGISYFKELPELIKKIESETDQPASVWAQLMMMSFRIPGNQHDVISFYKDKMSKVIGEYDIRTILAMFNVDYGFFNNFKYADNVNAFIKAIPALKVVGLNPSEVLESIVSRNTITHFKKNVFEDFFDLIRNDVCSFFKELEDEEVKDALRHILLSYKRLLYNKTSEYFNEYKKLVSDNLLYREELLKILDICRFDPDFLYYGADGVIDGYLTIDGMHFLDEPGKNELFKTAASNRLDAEFLYGIQSIIYATGRDFDFVVTDFFDDEMLFDTITIGLIGRAAYLMKNITDMSGDEIYGFLKAIRGVKLDAVSFNRDFIPLKLLPVNKTRLRLEIYKNLAENNRMTEHNYKFILDIGDYLNNRGLDSEKIAELQQSISLNRFFHIEDDFINPIVLDKIFEGEAFTDEMIFNFFETYWEKNLRCEDFDRRAMDAFPSYNKPPITAAQSVLLTRAAEYTDAEGIRNRIFISTAVGRDLLKIFGNDMEKISGFLSRAVVGFNNEQSYFRSAISLLSQMPNLKDLSEQEMIDFIKGYSIRDKKKRDHNFKIKDFLQYVEDTAMSMDDAAFFYSGYYKDTKLVSDFSASIGGLENWKKIDCLINQGRLYTVWRYLLEFKYFGMSNDDFIDFIEKSEIASSNGLSSMKNNVSVYNMLINGGNENPLVFKAVIENYNSPLYKDIFKYQPDKIIKSIDEAE